MKLNKVTFYRHALILALFFLFTSINLIFFFHVHDKASFITLVALESVILIIIAYMVHRWAIFPYMRILRYISDTASDYTAISDGGEARASLLPHIAINNIINHYKAHEKHQEELMEHLKHNNRMLQRNNNIMDSFMRITNKILSSGDIDTVLQSILDMAIEIIPHAQKGSILIYNGNEFEFKAVKGYNFDVLKSLRFKLEEAYQYGTEDFFVPIIINDVEEYNRKKLSKEKFDTLKQGRGFELKSSMSCAIEVDNGLFGLLNIDNMDSTEAFSHEDIPLIKHLAVQIGMALKNAALLEKIIFLSRHDSLTGIYNRDYFEQLLNRIYENALERQEIFSVAMLDINDLKMVNDNFGHEAGDLLIKRFVDVVKNNLDASDIFARMGGDEFTLVLPGKNKENVSSTIANINKQFAENPFTYCGREILNITYSCGITTYPEDTHSIDTLLRMADSCMYDIKKKFKNGFLE